MVAYTPGAGPARSNRSRRRTLDPRSYGDPHVGLSGIHIYAGYVCSALAMYISASVILGVPFLEDISPVWCDLRRDARTISFHHHEKEIKLTPSPEAMPGAPVISLKKALLEMRIGKRLLESTGSDAALAYLCVLLPKKEESEGTSDKAEESLTSLTDDPRPQQNHPQESHHPAPLLAIKLLNRHWIGYNEVSQQHPGRRLRLQSLTTSERACQIYSGGMGKVLFPNLEFN